MCKFDSQFIFYFRVADDEKRRKLEEQSKSNIYHRFVEGNLILKQGFLEKRKVSMCCWSIDLSMLVLLI
jgi:hypothetical protein